MKKNAKTVARTTPAASSRRKLALNKESLKDLAAGRAARHVKAGAYTQKNLCVNGSDVI